MIRTLSIAAALGLSVAFLATDPALGTARAADVATQWRDWPPDPRWTEERPWGVSPPPVARATFAALDTNRNFALSRAEAAASPALARNFDNADLDRDGRLAPLEFNNVALALALQ